LTPAAARIPSGKQHVEYIRTIAFRGPKRLMAALAAGPCRHLPAGMMMSPIAKLALPHHDVVAHLLDGIVCPHSEHRA
jgi:hypothetical protein